MDRTNIGFAFAGMGHELGITRTQQGLAGGIFFIGYLLLQIPGGHLAEHWSARKFVGIMILVWGALATASGFVHSFTQLVIVRFLLGIAEAGIWPAILVLISHWFPLRERARAYGYWIMNIPLASIVTAPLSGWILTFGSWRTLFIIEGIFPFVIAAPLWWLLIADRPGEAAWCSPAEREYIEGSLAAERAASPDVGGFGTILRSSVVWRLIGVFFLIQIGFYGLNLWLPHLVQEITHGRSLQVGLVTAVPYLFAMAGLWLNARVADRTGRYSRQVFLAVASAGMALALSVSVGTGAPAAAILLVSIAMAGALAFDGPFWACASRAMPVTLAGGAMGLINAVGNLGGFAGPYAGGYLQDRSGGSFLTTSLFLGASMFAAGLLMLTLRKRGDRPVDAPGDDARALALAGPTEP
ncbi:MAG TPA: MFS transporter, partial [Longimicrobiales bacterium]